MKGITPVIAIVLLLMITIALVGFAFIWFQSTFQTTTSTASSQIDKQTTAFGKTVRIEAAAGNSVSIRNVGSQTIAVNEIAVFVDGSKQGNNLPSDLIAGQVQQYTLTNACSGTGVTTVKVTAPGGSDKTTC